MTMHKDYFPVLTFKRSFQEQKGPICKNDTNLEEAVIRDSKASHQSQVKVLQTEGGKRQGAKLREGNLPPAEDGESA